MDNTDQEKAKHAYAADLPFRLLELAVDTKVGTMQFEMALSTLISDEREKSGFYDR